MSDERELWEFVREVDVMLKLQAKYFQTRDKDVLHESKKKEAEVRQMIRQLLATERQAELF